MRSAFLLLVCTLLLTGSLTATFGTIHLRNFELRGYVDPTMDKDIPFTVPRMGVNVELLQYDQAELITQLERLEANGFRWIRQFAYWDIIGSEPGEYDWSGWDRLAAAFADYPRLKPVVVLMNTPAWALPVPARDAANKTSPPADMADFAAFAKAFAERFGSWIDYYQIWDEPNLWDAWGESEPRPAEYVALLATARAAILEADPRARIIAAGLAPTTETAGRNLSDIRYLDAMYAMGARDIMDVVAGKPYGFSHSPLDRRVDEQTLNYSRLIALREVMTRNGDEKKPLWASNFGWNSLPPDWQGTASIWGAVTQAEQSGYTLQALDRAHREWPWLGAMFLHHWQPAAAFDDPQWGFSLLKQNGSSTTLLRALQSYELPQKAQNGLFHALNENARYSGLWQFSELGADIGWLHQSDSQLEFDFYGADIAMLLREDDYVAFLYPEVDGKPANATQTDSDGNAYIFLRSNSRGPETNLVPVSRNLTLDEHILHAVADKGWDRWAIAGYAVSSGNLALPYDQQIALGFVASLLSLLAFLHAMLTAPWRSWLPNLDMLASGISSATHLVLTGVASVFMMLSMLLAWDSSRNSILVRDDVNLLLALVTGGALYLSPHLLISLALACVIFVLVYQRLENGLILTLFWAPFFLFPVELYTYSFPMVEIMILITSVAGLVKLMAALGRYLQMSNSGFPIFTRALLGGLNPMDLAVGAIAILGAISLLWAEQPETARTELRTLIVEPVLFYLLLRAIGPNRTTLVRCFLALLLAGMLVALYGFFVYFTKDGSFSLAIGSHRLESVYGSANNVGLLFGRTVPFALCFALVPFDRHIRLFAALGLVVMLPALFLTQSVGAILLGAPAAIIAPMIILYRKRAIVPLVGAGVVGAGAISLLTRVSDRFATFVDLASGTTFVRVRLWESSLALLRDHPLTGIGLDQFLYRFGGEYLKPDAIWDRDLSHPHNFVLDFWTRLGIIGVLVFLFIQVVFWRSALLLARCFRATDPQLFAMTLGLMGSMAGLLAHGLIDNSVFVIDLAFIFMFQLAAMTRLREWAQRSAVNDP